MDVFCVILVTTFIFFSDGCEDPHWFGLKHVDKEINVYIGFESSLGSKSECASMCYFDPGCHSFQYNRNSGRCLTHPVSFEALWEQCAVPKTEKRVYYRIESDAIGSNCTSDTDCSAQDAICFQYDVNACTCEPGYSYDLPTQSCLTSCAVYGTDMTVYPGLLISGNNMRTVSGQVSVEQCIAECGQDNACRTFDYNIAGKSCVLQAVGFYDTPSGRIWGDSSWLHGHRDCGI